MATQVNNGFTKSMNGIVEYDDGSGFTTNDGNISCDNLNCNVLTAAVLNVASFIFTTLTATTAYITTLYVSNIRSNSLVPKLFSDTTYNAVELANSCDCDIALGNGQTAARLTIGGNTGRTGDVDIGNGIGNSCNVNLSTNILNTGQVGIKRFIFSLNNITSAVTSNAINLFTTTTNTITLNKFKFLNQIIDPVSPSALTSLFPGITSGGLIIGSNTMNSNINILNAPGFAVNIPNLVIGSLTGVTGNFDVAGSLTAGITNPALNHRISKVNITNQTIYAQDVTQPMQYATTNTTGRIDIGTSLSTGDLNLGNTTCYIKAGNLVVNGNNVYGNSGTLQLNPTNLSIYPTNLTIFNQSFRYVARSTYVPTPITGTCTRLFGSFEVIGNTMYLKIWGNSLAGGNTAGSGVYAFSLPSGYTIATNVYSASPSPSSGYLVSANITTALFGGSSIGSGCLQQAGAQTASIVIQPYDSTRVCAYVVSNTGGGAGTFHGSSYYQFNMANMSFAYDCVVPLV